MNIRIYQSYYLPEQISHLDPDGIPFDNTQNFLPELREYPIMQQIQHRCRLDQVDLWGMFSWKFTQKMNDLGAVQRVRDVIQAEPDHDVYLINVFPHDNAYIYNVWEQGDWACKDLFEIAEHVFVQMNLPVELLYQPTPDRAIVWCNFIVANQKFWDLWMRLVGEYTAVIDQLPADIQQRHNAGAGYGLDNGLSYFPFIVERLASTVLALNPQLKVLNHPAHTTYQAPPELVQLKQQAFEHNTQEHWQTWLDHRELHLRQHRKTYPNVTNLAQKFIDHSYSNTDHPKPKYTYEKDCVSKNTPGLGHSN